MSRSYYDRYDEFFIDGAFKIVPGIEIPFKPIYGKFFFQKYVGSID